MGFSVQARLQASNRCITSIHSCEEDLRQDLPVDGLVVGTPSMSAIGRHLAERCAKLEVHASEMQQVVGVTSVTDITAGLTWMLNSETVG